MQLFDFTPEELQAIAEREVRMRERVYPRWVAGGKMKPEKAEREIAGMKRIAEILKGLKKGKPTCESSLL